MYPWNRKCKSAHVYWRPQQRMLKQREHVKGSWKTWKTSNGSSGKVSRTEVLGVIYDGCHERVTRDILIIEGICRRIGQTGQGSIKKLKKCSVTAYIFKLKKKALPITDCLTKCPRCVCYSEVKIDSSLTRSKIKNKDHLSELNSEPCQ